MKTELQKLIIAKADVLWQMTLEHTPDMTRFYRNFLQGQTGTDLNLISQFLSI